MNKTEKPFEDKSLTGQSTPFEILYDELRQHAINKPKLKDGFTEDEIDVNYHSKVIDYNSSFLLAVIVLCVLKDGKFVWRIQTCFVSKNSAKQIAIGLLSKKQVSALLDAKKWAIGDHGVSNRVPTKAKTYFIWDIPFNENDYLLLDESIRKLAKDRLF